MTICGQLTIAQPASGLTAHALQGETNNHFDVRFAAMITSEVAAEEVLARYGGRVGLFLGADVTDGNAAASVWIPADQLIALRADDDVVSVIAPPDMRPHPVDVESVELRTDQVELPWSLDRLDSTNVGVYEPDFQGEGVHVYVVDTGLFHSAEYDDAVEAGYDAVNDDNDPYLDEDTCPLSHATQMVGAVAGTNYGTATQAIIHPVQIFDCAGNVKAFADGTNSAGRGLKWVKDNLELPAVINMSFGGPAPMGEPGLSNLEFLTRNLARSGAVVVASAGNDGGDACDQTPARLPEVVTVGAFDFDNDYAEFANAGPCVDLAAPGVKVPVVFDGSRTALSDGTSVAGAFVSGLMAQVHEDLPAAQGVQVAGQGSHNAEPGVSGNLRGAPDRAALIHRADADLAPQTAAASGCVDQSPQLDLELTNQTNAATTYTVSVSSTGVDDTEETRSVTVNANVTAFETFDVVRGALELTITDSSGDEVRESSEAIGGCGPVSTTVVSTCLAENGRVDSNFVNNHPAPVQVTMQLGSLSQRKRVIEPGDWWRSPITGRADGSLSLSVFVDPAPDGELVQTRGELGSGVGSVSVACDDEGGPKVSRDEVSFISACREGRGYILFLFANSTPQQRGYVIEFEGVPNRSTSAAAFSQSVRAVTGRPNGIYQVKIRQGFRILERFDVRVSC